MKNNNTEFHKVALSSSGEFFQESSALLFIFAVLDKVLGNQAVSIGYAGNIMAMTLLLFVLGCTCKYLGEK